MTSGRFTRPSSPPVRDRRTRRPAPHVEPLALTAAAVCAAAGVTYRRLDYWCSAGTLADDGHLRDIGHGGTRRFTQADVDVVRVLTAVADNFQAMRPYAGASTELLRTIAEQVRTVPTPPTLWLWHTDGAAQVDTSPPDDVAGVAATCRIDVERILW